MDLDTKHAFVNLDGVLCVPLPGLGAVSAREQRELRRHLSGGNHYLCDPDYSCPLHYWMVPTHDPASGQTPTEWVVDRIRVAREKLARAASHVARTLAEEEEMLAFVTKL